MSAELDEQGRSFFKGPGDAYRVRVGYCDDLPPAEYAASGHDVYGAIHGLLYDIIRPPQERVIRSFTVEKEHAMTAISAAAGMAGEPAVIRLEGLPDCCGSCGEAPADGTWPLGVAGHRLAVICPACFTAVAPVHAAETVDPVCE